LAALVPCLCMTSMPLLDHLLGLLLTLLLLSAALPPNQAQATMQLGVALSLVGAGIWAAKASYDPESAISVSVTATQRPCCIAAHTGHETQCPASRLPVNAEAAVSFRLQGVAMCSSGCHAASAAHNSVTIACAAAPHLGVCASPQLQFTPYMGG
jgi:hypothetical protein